NSYSAAVQLMHAEQEGWRPATKADLDNRGFGMPPTAHVAADGTIRRLDTALYIRDGEVARKWERIRAEAAERAEGHSFTAHLLARNTSMPNGFWYAAGPCDTAEAVPASAFSKGDLITLDSNSSFSRINELMVSGNDIFGVAEGDSTQSLNGRVTVRIPEDDTQFW